jgi:hypothetical protein
MVFSVDGKRGLGHLDHVEGNNNSKPKQNMNTTMKLMKQAREIKSPKHFELLFGRFQSSLKHLSIDLQDSANREFRRVAQAGWEKRNSLA